MRAVPPTVLVVIDEAYLHLNRAPGSAQGIEFFRSYPNVAVLHTVSKTYGLAGLRVGYTIAQAEVAANLRKTAIPFAVTTLVQRAAVASLDAEAELRVRIDALIGARAELSARFTAAGIEFSPSYANFIWPPPARTPSPWMRSCVGTGSGAGPLPERASASPSAVRKPTKRSWRPSRPPYRAGASNSASLRPVHRPVAAPRIPGGPPPFFRAGDFTTASSRPPRPVCGRCWPAANR